MTTIRILDQIAAFKGFFRLDKITFSLTRRDGTSQVQTREVFDRGHSACILLHDPIRGTTILTRQFRLPAHLAGHEGGLIEVCAGMLDAHDAETAIVKEAAEECGIEIRNPRRLFELFMSPGAMTEKTTFFVAEYAPANRVGAGGGVLDESEDIEVLELPLSEAIEMLDDGRIVDAKTFILLQWAEKHLGSPTKIPVCS